MEDLDSESGEIRPKFLFYKAKMASQVFPEIWEIETANICIPYGLRRFPLEKQNGENKVKSYPSRVLHGCFEVVFQPAESTSTNRVMPVGKITLKKTLGTQS